jgi:hypothetical protein
VSLADRLGERPLGVNVTMVYNWETGRHRPRPPYPRLLCLLYECSAEELGCGNRPAPVSCVPLVAWLSPRRALPVAGQNAHYA